MTYTEEERFRDEIRHKIHELEQMLRTNGSLIESATYQGRNLETHVRERLTKLEALVETHTRTLERHDDRFVTLAIVARDPRPS